MINILILAAGKGTRMQSERPKVLHTLAGKPLLQHVLDTAATLTSTLPTVIVGHGAEAVKATLAENSANFVTQEQQLGTGHAVAQALPYVDDEAPVLILCGDVPLIQATTLQSLMKLVSDTQMGLLTINLENPDGYGRILRDQNNRVVSIVEQKDATQEQCSITEINTGIMAIKGEHLKRWIPKLSNDNAQQEYYLTDIIALAQEDNIAVASESATTLWEVQGVNNRQQQAELERYYQHYLAEQLMARGVTLYDPARIDCRGELTVGSDVVIDINCVFEGAVSLGSGVVIGPNCTIKDATIGDNTQIHANSVIDSSIVDANCNIGPFARLRPGTQLAQGVKVGNFVETKKAIVGLGSKINHLSYIGDALIGEDVNIGAGTITCNYDGVNKFTTTIKDHVFVGSNSALVAPVVINEGATIGAGSTINTDVDNDALALARVRQRQVKGWQRPQKKK